MSKTIITISRQYCSGGLEVGNRLAGELGIDIYDKEQLVDMAAKQIGYDKSAFERVDEVATSSLLYSLALGAHMANPNAIMPDNDRLFQIQSDIIRNAAKEKSCIFIGRCSDYVLRDNPDAVNIYLRASMTDRINRHNRVYGEVKDTEAFINKKDKKKATYYKFYTGRNWSDIKNYDLCINTSLLSVDDIVGLITDFISKRTG